MSFYDNSSLAFLPSSGAGKDGKAYSIKPTNGTGDFTFSRGSNLAATRVGPTGLIEKGRENLLLQSNQFDTTWISTSLTPTSGQSGYDGSSDAWLIEKSASNGRIQQSGFGTLSGVYTISLYAKKNASQWMRILGNASTNGDVFIDLENGVFGTANNVFDTNVESLGNGWYRCSFSANYSGIFEVRIYPADSDGVTSGTSGSIYIQDAQLEIGLAATDYIESGATTGKAGLLEDEPRFDYSGGATCPSLLLEPSRTNLVTQSEYFEDSDWTNKVDITFDFGYLAPDGTNSAYKITSSGANAHLASNFQTSIVSGVHKSIWAKTTSGTGKVSLLNHNGDTNALFDITNEWQRFDISHASPNFFYAVDFRASGATLSEVLIWGAQAETGSYPTSYIPNHSGGTITRGADACGDAGDAATFNSTEGVLYAEISALADDLTTRQISINNGTTDDRIQLYYSSSSNQINIFYKAQSGATAFILSYVLNDIKTFNKIGFKWKTNDFALWVNGIEVDTLLNGVTSNANSLTKIDFKQFNNTAPFYGKTKQVIVFPTALSDADLATLTTL